MERNLKNGSKIKWASTNNVFFKSSVIKNNLKFSSLLNKTGGEKISYFLNYLRLGRFYWNSHAPVYELRDQKKKNFKWFFKS